MFYSIYGVHSDKNMYTFPLTNLCVASLNAGFSFPFSCALISGCSPTCLEVKLNGFVLCCLAFGSGCWVGGVLVGDSHGTHRAIHWALRSFVYAWALASGCFCSLLVVPTPFPSLIESLTRACSATRCYNCLVGSHTPQL